MGKKIDFSSPLGIAITVAGLLLVFSPGARSTLRRLMVNGTAAAMDAMEQVGGLTAGMMAKASGTAKRQDRTDTHLEVETFIHSSENPTSTSEQSTNTEES
ncbi:hypothetical protein GCM10025857_31030 [Alicyclobacillus contaminans]|uniref:hypothetical protein n=1 Tax=Alicyclobacillus contaminans TaxID=392016 RepID=UPI0003FC654E|nr:hypothetical protein [Alicyclobacillus contaminans]GMA51746.1 hypothetical protein GCM10025857_31030 [Alicyclobacillus contaminans]